MDYHFYSPLHYEKWDFRSPDDPGIGGSETAITELAWRLASRGHAVRVYAPIRDDCPPVDKGGAQWLPLDAADFTARGFWVLSRCPADIDKFEADHPFQKLWLVCQDACYPARSPWGLSHERAAKLDICVLLCRDHAAMTDRDYPELKGKLGLSANGFKTELAERIETEDDEAKEREPGSGMISRDPFKLIYTSSPDRGLLNLLKILKRAREFEPRLHLTASYGWNNLDKCERDEQQVRYRAECEALIEELGVNWLGRVGQETLYREFLSSGIWCYPTTFTETSCVTCMEAQALGAIPVTNPVWALADNVRHGIFIQGDPKDPFIKASYVAEIVALSRDPERQAQIRAESMPWAREQFNWNKIADQYEGYAQPFWGNQITFQIRHGNGRVLNIGSSADVAGFGARGAVNLDVRTHDPNGWENKYDILADCRYPLPFPEQSFDSIILGEILEHFTDDEAVLALKNAKTVLADNGHIVITCPDDDRPPEVQGKTELQIYVPSTNGFSDVKGYHTRPIKLETIRIWLGEAGLKEKHVEIIDYLFDPEPSITGHGVLAC